MFGDYDTIVIDTHGDNGNLTLAAIAAADAVLTVFTSDPGSALGAVRLSTFLAGHRKYENTTAAPARRRCAPTGTSRARPPAKCPSALSATNLPAVLYPYPVLAAGAERDAGKAPGRAVGAESAVAEAYRELATETITRYKKSSPRSSV